MAPTLRRTRRRPGSRFSPGSHPQLPPATRCPADRVRRPGERAAVRESGNFGKRWWAHAPEGFGGSPKHPADTMSREEAQRIPEAFTAPGTQHRLPGEAGRKYVAQGAGPANWRPWQPGPVACRTVAD